MTQTWVLTSIPLSTAVALATPNPHGVTDITPDTIRWLHTAVASLARSTGDVELTAVTPNLIAQWQATLAPTVSPVTANSYLRGIKTLYGRLQKNGIVGTNPAQPVRYLPQPQPNPKAISHADYQKMLTAAEEVRDKAIIATLWATGARVGGLLSMEVGEIESWESADSGSEGLCYAIPVTEKFGKKRYVYLNREPAEELSAWLLTRPSTSPSTALFTTIHGHRLTRPGLNALLRKIRMAAKVNGRCNPHSFRHAFAIRKLEEGYDLATVSQWLGHTSPEFTAKVYCVRSESQLRSRYFSPPT